MLKLYKYEIDLNKATSTSDTSLIPAGSIACNVYRQGATLNATLTAAAGVVAVDDIGSFVQNTMTFTVGTVNDNTVNGTISTVPTTSTAFSYADTTGSPSGSAGDRLISTFNQPLTYTDDQGVTATAVASQVTTDSTGKATFYCREAIVDIETVDSSVTPNTMTLLTDVSGTGTANRVWLDDFDAIANGTFDNKQAFTNAIAYLNTRGGGVLELGTGTYVVSSGVTLSAVENLTIVGQGRGITKIKIGHPATGFAFSGTKENFKLSNLTLYGTASTARLLDIGASITGFVIEDVEFQDAIIGVFDAGTDTRYNRVKFTDLPGGTAQWGNFIVLSGATRPHINSLIGRASTTISSAGINIDKTVTGARLSDVDIQPAGAFGSTGGIPILIQDTATTTPPKDIKIRDSKLVGGITTDAAAALKIVDCDGVELIGVNCEDSLIGIDIDGGTSIKIIGGSDIFIQQDGIDIDGTPTHIRIVERESSNCSNSGAGSYDHINIAAGVDDVSINGLTVGRFIRGTSVGAAAGYGVQVEAGASERIQILGIRGTFAELNNGWFLNASTSNSVDISHNIEDGNSRSYAHTATSAGESTGGVVGVIQLAATEVTAVGANVSTIVLAQSSATNFATITQGANGQVIRLVATNGNTTVTETGNIVLEKTAATWNLAANDTLELMYEANVLSKWVETSRSDNS